MFFTIKKKEEEEEVEVFRTIYYPFYSRMYRVAFRLLRNAQDAEDIVQDVFLHLWEKRNLLDAIENVEAYCVRMVRNHSIDFLRSRPIIEELSSLDDSKLEVTVCNVVSLEKKDEVEWVKILIELLPENQQRIIIMRDVEECSLKEIEDATGLSAVNVRVLLSRARKKIREQIINIMNYEKR